MHLIVELSRLLSLCPHSVQALQKTMFSICVVTEAMEAYQLFCSVVPRHMDGPLGTKVDIDIGTASKDFSNVQSFLKKYKQTHHNQWWGSKSEKDILSMLSVLPLNEESYHEVLALVVKLIHM
jgi:hypothetical protein